MSDLVSSSASDAIMNYVNSEDELAFQVNGPWGSGKTHYVVNTIIPELQEQSRVPVYFSLNGLKDIEVVKKSVNRKVLLNFVKDKGDKYNLTGKLDNILDLASGADLGNSIANTIMNSVIFPIKEKVQDSLLEKVDFANFVLIIDDLERIAEPLQTKEVFGYIATLQEQWKCKIIIISNEEKSYDSADIALIKEKVINKSLEFNEDVFGIAENIIDYSLEKISIDQDIKDWEVAMAHKMLAMVTSKEINLRTVKSIMSSYSEFNSYVLKQRELTNDKRKQIAKTGFLSIFVLTDCFKRGYTEKSKGILDVFDVTRMRLPAKHNTQKESNVESISERILRVFHGNLPEFDENIVYTRQILNLVVHDSFDFKEFYNEIQNILFPQVPEQKQRLDKLEDFRALSAVELSRAQLDMKEHVNLKQDNFKYLLRVFRVMQYLKTNSLLLVDWNIEEIYIELLSRLSKMDEAEVGLNEWTFLRTSGDPADEKENSLRKAYKSRQEKLNENDDINMLELILNGNWYDKNKDKSFFKKRSLFKMLIDENVIDNVFSKVGHNDAIRGLESYVHDEIVSISNAKDFHAHELEYAEQFLENMKVQESLVRDKVQRFNYKELENEISQAIDCLA
ncbi:P-loop NTPase fold protein [Levilactobacillus tongjiangensis]|uniref:P-loop NTPase fold protein n=1 Tax=Levilactobacillus tongjiangensis TaxID=2486023 RepID=A0ABW1SRA9_9LACO|nr:P-loop NTPase fold protein [Levilactobacillus tongjiangensis]